MREGGKMERQKRKGEAKKGREETVGRKEGRGKR